MGVSRSGTAFFAVIIRVLRLCENNERILTRLPGEGTLESAHNRVAQPVRTFSIVYLCMYKCDNANVRAKSACSAIKRRYLTLAECKLVRFERVLCAARILNRARNYDSD